jgi:hypothetical protein
MSDKIEPKTYFWPYDIFGYLLPGVIAIAPLITFHDVIRSFFKTRYQSESIADNIVLLVAIYVVGHIISAASSLLLERGLLRLSFGYPLSQFLGRKDSGTIFRNLVLHLASPNRWFLLSRLPRTGRLSFFYKSICVIAPTLERRLDLLPGFCHPFDDSVTDLVLSRFKMRFGIHFEKPSIHRVTHEIYWTVWAYIAENMPNSYRTGMHFLELYGFCRNSSFAFLLAAFYPYIPGWNSVDPSGKPFFSQLVWTIICVLCSILLYSNFTKLLRRQNDFVLRSFISEKSGTDPNHQAKLISPPSP